MLQNKLNEAQEKLEQAGIKTARLDCLVLAEFVLAKDRAWILANLDFEFDAKISQKFDELVAKRLKNIPIAYLVGKKEFYGRNFTVTSDVLIPRPETEALIEIAKKYVTSGTAVDIGTGSGAVAITLALETSLKVSACDISTHALKIAKHNAKNLKAQVSFFQSNLLKNTNQKRDIIVANLPYVDKTWDRSPETDFEPDLALFADDFGLALIKKLINQSPNKLNPNGYLLLEADPRHHKLISEYSNKFRTLEQKDFAILLQLK